MPRLCRPRCIPAPSNPHDLCCTASGRAVPVLWSRSAAGTLFLLIPLILTAYLSTANARQLHLSTALSQANETPREAVPRPCSSVRPTPNRRVRIAGPTRVLVQNDGRPLRWSVTMQIISGRVPRARYLARGAIDVSQEARQRLRWFDCYRSHGRKAAHQPLSSTRSSAAGSTYVYNTVRPPQALGYLTPQGFLAPCQSQTQEARCH
jgi:transposase InsO family protein